MAVLAIVANPGPTDLVVGLNTVPAHTVQALSLEPGDSDAFLQANCALVAPLDGLSTAVEEAIFMLGRNPSAVV
jgi:hypothetical protein